MRVSITHVGACAVDLFLPYNRSTTPPNPVPNHMPRTPLRAIVIALLVTSPAFARAQDIPTGDTIIKKIYDEGMRRSQAYKFGQALMDSIGPRLTGAPQNRAANDFIVRTYAGMGVSARNEQYGAWRDWTRGLSRIELLTPRAKNLEALVLPWSTGTAPA